MLFFSQMQRDATTLAYKLILEDLSREKIKKISLGTSGHQKLWKLSQRQRNHIVKSIFGLLQKCNGVHNLIFCAISILNTENIPFLRQTLLNNFIFLVPERALVNVLRFYACVTTVNMPRKKKFVNERTRVNVLRFYACVSTVAMPRQFFFINVIFTEASYI